MPRITYINAAGERFEVEAEVGQSVMQAAIFNNITGIEAECGGSCSCATCHVYVAEADQSLFSLPDALEDELLEGVAAERKENSRLSCQLSLTAEHQHITVEIPEAQY